MGKNKIIRIECPGCGKDLHTFMVPSKPGTYRLMCKSDRSKPVLLKVNENGSIESDKINRNI